MTLLIVGTGSIGMRHLRNALEMGHVCWFYEPHLSRAIDAMHLVRDYGVAGGRCHEWTDQAFDAVLVCSPWNTHLEWVERAVSRRIAVFVEKPLGAFEEIAAWRKLVGASNGLVTQVGYMLRFHSTMQMLRNGIPDPKIGRFRCHADTRTWPGQGYGPFLLEASHEIDLSLWSGAELPIARVEREPTTIAVTFSNGWSVELCDHVAYGRQWSLDGVTASFHAPEELGTLMYRDELEHFLECVRDQRRTDCPLSDGLKTLEVCQQIQAMAVAA